MNRKLNIFSSVGFAALSLLACVSCGGGGNPTSEPVTSVPTSESTSSSETVSETVDNSGVDFVVPEAGFNTNETVTITFYHTMGQALQEVLDIYLEDFYMEYPNIKVISQSIGGYDDVRDQMTTQISAGASQCDIAYCYPDHIALYNKAKSVITLNNLIDDPEYGFSQEQKDDFVEAYYNEGKCFGDDKMYCLPFSKSSEVLYYDKTFFAKNNLTVPTTWDEMEETCRKIKAIDPISIPLGYDSSSNWFITMCEQYGSGYTTADPDNHFVFNNDTNKAFMKEFWSWKQDGLVTTKGLYGSYTSGLFTNLDGQRSYMCIGSSAGASYQTTTVGDKFAFDTGIVAIPQVKDGARRAVISQGPDLCLFNSKNPQKIMASWLLMKFLTTNVEFQAQFSISSGYTPVIKSVNDFEIYADFLENADGGKFIAALSTQVTVSQEADYFTSPAFVGSAQARDEMGSLVDGILSYQDEATIDDYINSRFNAAVEACNAAAK